MQDRLAREASWWCAVMGPGGAARGEARKGGCGPISKGLDHQTEECRLSSIGSVEE